MFFTQDDYRKIEKWLLANGKKDTEFALASAPFKGNETVVLVQNGKNVKVSLKDLVDQIFLLGVSDFLNVTDKYNASLISLTSAIQLIPFKSRKLGQVITFLNENNLWGIYQFQGSSINQWNNPTLWIQVIGSSNIEVVPDNEDLTGTKEGNRLVLSFANKAYEPNQFSGLGRVYLRKNIQTVLNPDSGEQKTVNLLTQDMVSKEDTIYHIQYDYDLNGTTIVIPDGCVLQFEGGSISNGTLNGNATCINSEPTGIFNNIIFLGTFMAQIAFAEWFLEESDVDKINKAISTFKNVRLLNKTYYIDKTTDNNLNCIIVPENAILSGSTILSSVSTSKTTLEIKGDFKYKNLLALNSYIAIKDIYVKGGRQDFNCGIGNYNEGFISRVLLEKVEVSGTYYGFNLHMYLSTLNNCISSYNNIGFFIHGTLLDVGYGTQGTSLSITGCYAVDSKEYGYFVKSMTYCTMNNCAADGCGVPTTGMINNDTIINAAYKFEHCESLTVNSIGLERGLKALELRLCRNIVINTPNFFITNPSNTTIEDSFILQNLINLEYSTAIELSYPQVKLDTMSRYYTNTTQLLRLYGTSTDYLNLVLKNGYQGINYSNIGFVGGLNYLNLKYIEKTKLDILSLTEGSFSTMIMQIYNSYRYNKYIQYNITLSENTYNQSSGITMDNVNINIASDAIQRTLNLIGKITFNNSKLTFYKLTIQPNSSITSLESLLIFNNCDVSFEGCTLIIPNVTILDTFIKGINSNVKFNNCIVYCTDSTNYGKIIPTNALFTHSGSWYDIIGNTKILFPQGNYLYKDIVFKGNADYKSVINTNISKINGIISLPNLSPDMYIGFKYFNTNTGNITIWNGETWINEDDTLASKVIII